MASMLMLLVLGAALASAAQIVVHFRARLEASRRETLRCTKSIHQLSAKLRADARDTLRFKREIRALERAAGLANDATARSQAEVASLQSIARRLYILEDLRTAADSPFVVQVSHPEFGHIVPMPPNEIVADWRTGRSYIVWAVDAKKATTKAQMRFPAKQGYQVSAATACDSATAKAI